MSKDSYQDLMAKGGNLSESDQTKAGQPVIGAMGSDQSTFLVDLFKMIDEGLIEIGNPTSYLNPAVYEKLGDEWREKADLALINLDNQLSLIQAWRDNEKTPEAAPQLQTMVEQLWQMKAQIEEGSEKDVFKF